MILSSIYLLLINNVKALRSIDYITEFSKTLIQLVTIYTLPFIIFNTITQLSSYAYINKLCYNIYWYLYHIPSFGIIYMIHNSKLIKLLEVNNISYNNPQHIYLTVLYTFIYVFLIYIVSACNSLIWVRYLCDTIGLSLFFSEIGYQFLDNSKYQYCNRVDFYNSNWYIFMMYGYIVSYILYYIPEYIFIPVSYVIISVFQNIFINVDYNRHDYFKNYRYNLLYIFEYIFNKIVSFISTFVFYTLGKRTMIMEPT